MEGGHDPLELQVREARRIGIDFWFRLSMNDWHHVDAEGKVYRLMGSRFYADHPEYLIGKEGVKGWPESLQRSMAWFQDYAHPEVRRLRMDLADEACRRYDVDGFEYDFMRCPGYFKYGEEERNTPLMTEFIRDTRKKLDRIGGERGRPLGLSVRVPNTIEGARRLGLDVVSWIEEELVDIVVPSTFFMADVEEDISGWTEITRDSPVRINPAIEEGYMAGHRGGVVRAIYRAFYAPPCVLPVTVEMARAVAARHWQNGADGLYVFNWFGTAPTYDYDNRTALDDIGNPLRLKHKNKRYVVMRTVESFPNCLVEERQIPARVENNPVIIKLVVADDLPGAGERVTK